MHVFSRTVCINNKYHVLCFSVIFLFDITFYMMHEVTVTASVKQGNSLQR